MNEKHTKVRTPFIVYVYLLPYESYEAHINAKVVVWQSNVNYDINVACGF